MKQRYALRMGDILLMVFLCLAALILFLRPFLAKKAATAQIILAETGETRTVSLGTDAAYPLTAQGISLTVTVKNGTIFVSQSDCRDGICRNTPPISRAGQSIVCAPAGIVIRITGEEATVDGVSG